MSPSMPPSVPPSMPPSSSTESASSASAKREAQRITLISAALDGVLGVAKLVIGKMVGSQALIADGIHSLSDLVTDAFVLVATHFGRQAPDRSHPWGHERIETLGTLVLGSLLLAVAGAIGWEGILRSWELMFGSLTIPLPGALGIGIAIISLLGKEGIFRATLRSHAGRTPSYWKPMPGTRAAMHSPRWRYW